MQNIINALNSLTDSVVNYLNVLVSANLSIFNSVYIAKNIVDFILQFIPKPMLWLFCVEMVWGAGNFVLNVIGKFKMVVKWW